MASKPSRASGYHHGDLRNALEQAALELVATRGVHGFTLAEASRLAGVSVAAPFKHYANREALLASLALRSFHEQERRFSEAVQASSDPADQLASFAAAYVRFAVEERALFETTFGAGIDKTRYPDLQQAGRTVLDTLTGPARALRGSPEAAVSLVHAVAAVAHGYAAFLHEGVFGDEPDARALAEENARASARILAQDRCV